LMALSTFQASQESAEELTGLLNMLNITLDLAKVSDPRSFGQCCGSGSESATRACRSVSDLFGENMFNYIATFS
jgi:hypothetical protein